MVAAKGCLCFVYYGCYGCSHRATAKYPIMQPNVFARRSTAVTNSTGTLYIFPAKVVFIFSPGYLNIVMGTMWVIYNRPLPNVYPAAHDPYVVLMRLQNVAKLRKDRVLRSYPKQA